MSRAAGELVRLRHLVDRMRATLDGVDLAIRIGGGIGQDTTQVVLTTAGSIATTIATHDAFVLAQRDAEPCPYDCHRRAAP